MEIKYIKRFFQSRRHFIQSRIFLTFVLVCLIEFGFSFKLSARPKKPYKISGEIVYEQQNDDSDDVFVELCFKNKSDRAVISFSAAVYVSVSSDYEELFEYGFEESEAEDYVDYGNRVFNFSIEERVGGNGKEIFVCPLGFSSVLNYEIDFIYVTEIMYEDDEKK